MLSISTISSSHSGNYSCRISNRFGSDSFTSELIVEGTVKLLVYPMIFNIYNVSYHLLGPPQWLEKPEMTIKSILGEKIVVKCSASGYPKPNIQWKIKKGSNSLYTNNILSLSLI